jgi:hypothetical protein
MRQDSDLTLCGLVGVSKASSFDRRTLLKGIGLFLGAGVFNTGFTACDSAPYLPKKLKAKHVQIEHIQQTWSVPSDVKTLGQEIVKVVGNVEVLVQDLLKQIEQEHPKDFKGPKELSNTLKKLHLDSARKGQWVEVRAWRLTAIEVAAYVLCSYEAPTP